MYTHVIFDVDGTMIDTGEAIIGSLREMLEQEYGMSYTHEQLEFVLGIPGVPALERLGIREPVKASESWYRFMAKYSHTLALFPGIRETLQTLHDKGIRLGIVTSRTRLELEYDFNPFGISALFGCIVCADDTSSHKPHPAPILKYLELTEAEPQKTLYIGDTVYDCQSATGAGVAFGLASWGAVNIPACSSDFVFQKPEEIIPLIWNNSDIVTVA